MLKSYCLTCFARYLLSSLWLLSICLEIAPRDVRLNSRFSILSFVANIGISHDASAAGKGFNIPSILRDGNYKTHHSPGCLVVSQHSEHVPVSIKIPVHMWVNEKHFRVIRLCSGAHAPCGANILLWWFDERFRKKALNM